MRKCLFQKKTENNLTVKLEGQHKEIYEGILTETREMYKKMMNDLCSFTYVLAMFTRLRQCAIAPYLITPDAKRNSKEKNNCSNGVLINLEELESKVQKF